MEDTSVLRVAVSTFIGAVVKPDEFFGFSGGREIKSMSLVVAQRESR